MSPAQQDFIPHIPPKRRVYAIGDIHGRYDLLQKLLGMIMLDAHEAGDDARNVLVFMGDYVDRGPDSRRVVELLSASPPAGFEIVCLKGNHEDMLLQFLEGCGPVVSWLKNGGRETLKSYDQDVKSLSVSHVSDEAIENVRLELRATIPGSHVEFLASLELSHIEGDYIFVHAGLRPGVALGQQQERDQIWIRDDFLKSRADFGKIVVHGHSITSQPSIKINRIGIDTGAWRTNILTCLVLEGAARRFIAT